MDFTDQRKRCHEYVDALEEERRKIQVFQRELPLCLELVTQAIEAYRRELSGSTPTEYTTTVPGQSDCSEHTSSGGGPVLEEFIPIKPQHNSSCNDDDEEEEEENENENHRHTNHHNEDDDHRGSGGDGERSLKRNRSQNEETEDNKSSSSNKKSDWLRSVQLWNQSPDPPLPNEEVPRKAVVKEVRRNGSGGAFQPFQKEKNSSGGGGGGFVGKSNGGGGGGGGNHDNTITVATAAATTPSSVLSSSAAAAGTSGGAPSVSNTNSNKQQQQKFVDNKEAQAQQRKQRRCWSPELHRRFLHALQQLGGSHAATPKQIRELMKVDGLTNDEVKSHLQKYRLHTRRPSHGVQNTSNPPGPQFVVVGGIWVPPSAEYAAAAAAAAAAATSPRETTPSGSIYAPVAKTVAAQRQQARSTEQLQSEGRGSSRSEGGGGAHRPCSPSTCSSTRTATSTPGS
ncbi:unnamed protein product [Linum tenue]|uniref:HTH myb-type domain-containing protein n=1 Tax=Linum tenue TaxID=586396 RepID=A0AAV0NKM8_9ROSI|nr:unnamed protein product [Linum tenue]